jgi:hypothetical protein
MNKLYRRSRHLVRGLLLPAGLAALAASAAAGQGPLADKCNENQGLGELTSLALGNAVIQPLLTGIPLEPGQTVPTNGTDKVESPELAGKVAITGGGSFSFAGITGTYEEFILASHSDGTCKHHTQVKVVSGLGCITRVRFHQYFHPLDIVADYRTDKPGKVRSKTASRTEDGLTFEFQLKTKLCAGQSTRWLLLNTSIRHMQTLSALELVADDGSLSSPLPVHVPAP